jgi:hypothetical protein
MLSFILHLVHDFELEHGVHPNLLYLNHFHAAHLKNAFDDNYSISTILELLDMELIVESDITHPHVAWTQVAQRASAF